MINTGIFPVIPFGGPEAVRPPLLQASPAARRRASAPTHLPLGVRMHRAATAATLRRRTRHAVLAASAGKPPASCMHVCR